MKKMFSYGLGLVLILISGYILFLHFFSYSFEEIKDRYATEDSRFIEVAKGIQVHYQIFNPEKDETLVMVHGSNMSTHAWEGWVRTLSPYYRLITVDMPGHGLTGRIKGDDYTAANMARVLHLTMQSLKVNHFFLAGNSMGGRITWNYAFQYPNDIDGIILMDASGYPSENEASGVFALTQLPIIRNLSKMPIPKVLMKQGLLSAVEDKSLITEDMVEMYWAMNNMKGTAEANSARFKVSKSEGYKNISRITNPALIMWGEKDALVPVEDAKKFEQDLANGEILIYPEIGHMPMVEIPQKSANDVRSFIQKIIELKQSVTKE